jgi:hypothetical protein
LREIGGYFGLEKLSSNEYHNALIPLNTASNALLYILKAKKIRKLYIPYYLCDSIKKMLEHNNYDFGYYNIGADFEPMFDVPLGDEEYLLIVNYYGQLTDEVIGLLKKKHKKIIIDNVQSFFQKPINGIDTFYSCRKFFGVPDGAYLSTDVLFNENLGKDISGDRMKHILGRFEAGASDYYKDFQKNELDIKDEPLKWMSDFTHNILGAIDYEAVRKIRNENFAKLHENLKVINKLEPAIPDAPFAYPLEIKDRTGLWGQMPATFPGNESIRKHLIDKKIYIPTLWTNVLNDTDEGSIEYKYAANILPLPCDQRYGPDDMEYIIHNIQEEVENGQKTLSTGV